MTRLPVRLRLTAAFALAMVVVLVAACAFVYVRLRADLDDAIDGALQTRSDAALALVRGGSGLSPRDAALLTEVDESFAQVLAPDGRVLAAIGAVRGPALRAADVRRATRGEVRLDRRLDAFDDAARVTARPVFARGDPRVVVVGQSLTDRNETLRALVAAFAVGGPVAILVASALGYALAASGLAPVEAMRRRATEISLARDGQRLPLPAAHDEIRRLGETLNAMLDRLQRSFEHERRFVADASHELRSPIAVIKTELEGVLRSGDHAADTRQALVAAAEECDRLAQLAEDLLVLARAADGRLPTHAEPARARAVLEATRERFADRAAERGRPIRVEAADDLVVTADPLRLRQALGNLVDNALRHGAGDIVLGARPLHGGVELEVADRGAGFTAAMADHAFERFTRGDEARTGEGAGLGLAIVKAIAEAHDGRAAISRDDGATSVSLWFPGGGRSTDAPPPAPGRDGAPDGSHASLI